MKKASRIVALCVAAAIVIFCANPVLAACSGGKTQETTWAKGEGTSADAAKQQAEALLSG